jgi:hypothetical protein
MTKNPPKKDVTSKLQTAPFSADSEDYEPPNSEQSESVLEDTPESLIADDENSSPASSNKSTSGPQATPKPPASVPHHDDFAFFSADPFHKVLTEALVVFDPTFLDQSRHDPLQPQELFFRVLLPTLAIRIDHANPLSSGKILPDPTPSFPVGPWLCNFSLSSFDILTARALYDTQPIRYIGLLRQYVIFIRAQTVHDKLCRQCAEFYLLGQSYSNLKSCDANVE